MMMEAEIMAMTIQMQMRMSHAIKNPQTATLVPKGPCSENSNSSLELSSDALNMEIYHAGYLPSEGI
jgi:hypothetical protein